MQNEGLKETPEQVLLRYMECPVYNADQLLTFFTDWLGGTEILKNRTFTTGKVRVKFRKFWKDIEDIGLVTIDGKTKGDTTFAFLERYQKLINDE